jgi:molybdopterin-guanine dinucleotide biosynthesis protein A
MAVDMPFLETELLNYLVGQARRTSAMLVVPRPWTSAATLCVYRRAFAEVAERSLRAGENKIDRFVLRSGDPGNRA